MYNDSEPSIRNDKDSKPDNIHVALDTDLTFSRRVGSSSPVTSIVTFTSMSFFLLSLTFLLYYAFCAKLH